MDYSLLVIRTPDEGDDRLYPTVSDARDVALDALDGQPLRLLACALAVSEEIAGSWQTHTRLSDVEVDVLITDARVAVACRDVPGDSARKMHESALLVGHIRYPWLRWVGFKPAPSPGVREEVRLGVVLSSRDGLERELFLDVELSQSLTAANVARATVARAVRYQLAFGLDNGAAAQGSHLATGVRLEQPEPNRFSLYQLPAWSPVTASFARPTKDTPVLHNLRFHRDRDELIRDLHNRESPDVN